MERTRNVALIRWMDDTGTRTRELTDAVNDAVRELTGRQGQVTERTVMKWRSGETRRPQSVQRAALRAVTGLTDQQLGFAVRRRNFIATAAAVSTVPLLGARPSVGTCDVIRLREGMDALTHLDQRRGGHAALERSALAGATEAVALQQKAASQTIRQRLFSVAANYTAAAAWSCIDARHNSRAQAHLNEALRLAGMAQDPIAQMRVWNSTAILAHQRGDAGEVIAAAHAAQATAITRRDPLFASLAHARTAIGHAQHGDRQAALRSLGHAEDALTRAQPQPRPGWIAFYGPAELHALTGLIRNQLADPANAEAAAHRALAALPAAYRRNRAMTTMDLATAQLHQGDVEQACTTTEGVFTLMSGSPLPGRLRVLLGDYYRELLTLAPSAQIAREWGDRYRSQWSPS
ncbi:hypothetical protein [Streptomyces sp. cg36]|uniref:hypothetical protein n=1 Tax=Streptomyces sp. cg36 TaxID=3238798 RepID=UPI0034E2C157